MNNSKTEKQVVLKEHSVKLHTDKNTEVNLKSVLQRQISDETSNAIEHRFESLDHEIVKLLHLGNSM